MIISVGTQIRLLDSGASISLILEAKFPASRQKFPVPLLREFRRKPLNSLVSSALNGV